MAIYKTMKSNMSADDGFHFPIVEQYRFLFGGVLNVPSGLRNLLFCPHLAEFTYNFVLNIFADKA